MWASSGDVVLPSMRPRTVPGRERTSLGFRREALDAFGFLTTSYGLRCAKALGTYVRYESDHVFVNVFHGRSSYEVNVEVGRRTGAGVERPFYLAEIVELCDGPAGYRPPQATSIETVRRFVGEVAAVVQRCAGPLLAGDHAAFEEIARVRSERSGRYIIDAALRSARAAVADAWRDRLYDRVVEALEPVAAHLTPSEARMLAYSRRLAASRAGDHPPRTGEPPP